MSKRKISKENTKAKERMIIQMHMWSCNNIRDVLPQVAEADFKMIHVSPIQSNKDRSEWCAHCFVPPLFFSQKIL